MRTTFMICATLIGSVAHAQTPPPIQWQHVYGGSGTEVGYSIRPTSDGGYITSSTTQSNDGDVSGFHGTQDLWVAKLNADGAIEWERCYGGSASETSTNIILEAPEGGYLITANTNSDDGDVSCVGSGSKGWLVRVDHNGELLWDICPAGPATNSLRAAVPAFDGGWLVCGSTWTDQGVGCGMGQTDLWLAHVSDDGQVLWSRCYGGSLADGASSIIATNDGGYILVGATRSNDGDLADINPYWEPPLPSSTGWVLKVDTMGGIVWQHCYGGSSNDDLTVVMGEASGGFWILGGTHSDDGDVTGHHGERDGWVLYMDVDGNLQEQRCIGGSAEDRMYSFTLLPSGHALVVGYTHSIDGDVVAPHGLSDAWAIELDPDLNIVWERSYGGTSFDRWMDVLHTADDGVVLIGNTWSNDGDLIDHPGHGQGDTWIMKLAPWDHTGVEEQAGESGILLYPNPTTGDLQLQAHGLHGDGWQLQIVDALGRMVYTATLNTSRLRTTLPTQPLAQGTYALRLYRGSESHVRRFIKQ